MSERYSKIFSLSENLYADGSPIIIKAGALLKDNESGSLIAQLKLHSIVNKKIKFAKAEITLLDSVGRQLGDPFTFDYLDLSISRDAFFGTQTPIRIGNSAARSYTVKIVEVGFVDNSVWRGDEKTWEQLPSQMLIEKAINNKNAVAGYKAFFGEYANFQVCEYADIWCCTCGEINHKSEDVCHHCGVSHEELKNISVDALEREGFYATACEMLKSNKIDTVQKAISEFDKLKDYKDSTNLIEACKEKIAKLENAENAKITKCKKLKISAFISGAVIILGLLGYFAIYPLIAFMNGNYAPYINIYNVKEFKVSDSVTSIEDGMFEDCDSLTSISIPDGVTSIGDRAFYGCTNLASISIPDGVTSIGHWAFYGCTNLASISIPDSVVSFGSCAFRDCTSLTSIIIPDSVTSIADRMFEDCDSLTSVTIGNSVTTIGAYAFRGCDRFTSIYYNGTKSMWNNIDYDYWPFSFYQSTVYCTDGKLKYADYFN